MYHYRGDVRRPWPCICHNQNVTAQKDVWKYFRFFFSLDKQSQWCVFLIVQSISTLSKKFRNSTLQIKIFRFFPSSCQQIFFLENFSISNIQITKIEWHFVFNFNYFLFFIFLFDLFVCVRFFPPVFFFVWISTHFCSEHLDTVLSKIRIFSSPMRFDIFPRQLGRR